ncbi:MAG: hypothetical protein LIO91_07105, partial [Bacteroidales bacterium]|nr:hypothetical protein [Bacteroidales bacterium]
MKRLLVDDKEPSLQWYNTKLRQAMELEGDLANGGKKERVDEAALGEWAREQVPTDDTRYQQWVSDMFKNVIAKKGIYNGKDPFTPSGNRRSWESLHDAFTIGNIVKAMLRENQRGGQGFWSSNIVGASSKEYGSIDQIRREAKGRIRDIGDEAYQEGERSFNTRFGDIVSKVLGREGDKGERDLISRVLDAKQDFSEAVGKTHTAQGLYKELHRWYPTLTMEDCARLEGLIKEVQQAATKFFEAKPRRAVGFDEVKLALVPSGTDGALIEALRSRGIETRVYEAGDQEQRVKLLDAETARMDIQFMIMGERGAAALDKKDGGTRMEQMRQAEDWEKRFKDLEGNPEERKRVQKAAKTVRELEAVSVKDEDMPKTKTEAKQAYDAIGDATNRNTGKTVRFYNSAFKKNHREGGLFERSIPALKEAFEGAVLAYQEEDTYMGKERPDGTTHKGHPNVETFDNYVGKVSLNGQDYYVRYTVQSNRDGEAGTHSMFVTDVELYNNAGERVNDTEFPSGRTPSDGVVDAKLQRFFALASGDAHEFAKALRWATGWERGADGKWRWEEMDGEADFSAFNNPKNTEWENDYQAMESLFGSAGLRFNPNTDQRNDLDGEAYSKYREWWKKWHVNGILQKPRKLMIKAVRLKDLIGEGSPVLEAYPGLAELAVMQKPMAGRALAGYVPTSATLPAHIVIDLNKIEERGGSASATLLHEVQHAIQHIEGFARGGNTRTQSENFKDIVDPRIYLELQKAFGDKGAVSMEEVRRYIRDKADDLSLLPSVRGRWREMANAIWRGDIAESQLRQLLRDYLEYYRSLAGEVEARNASERMNWSEEKRRGTLLSESEDVARDAQIVLMNQSGPSLFIGKRARAEYERLLEKKRPDMPKELRQDALDYLHSLEDTKENNRKVKIAVKWLGSSDVTLPNDAALIDRAIALADRAKVDPMSYDSPREVLSALADVKEKEKPINPDDVPQLSNKKDYGNGLVVYDVEDTKAGQAAMRRIIDTHYGKDKNPWCLLQGDGEGN